jgi:hypothetical protein
VASGTAQTSSAGTPNAQAGIAAAQAQVTALRDSFVKATVAAGFTCTLAPPKIVMEDVPSYGNYDEDTNTLKSSAWELLTEREKGSFFRLTGPNATEESARKEFETGAHHWVFVHELGHWWQACGHVQPANPYLFESGANRVAAAYWREHTPAVVAHQRGVFEYVLNKVPAPELQGQEIEAYFNAHYPDKYVSVQEYIWFQSKMCLKAFDEKPAPSFAEALKETAP